MIGLANESKNNESMPAIEIDASDWAVKESVLAIQKIAKNKENRE
jgi:predicted transcriptional regulator YdeE